MQFADMVENVGKGVDASDSAILLLVDAMSVFHRENDFLEIKNVAKKWYLQLLLQFAILGNSHPVNEWALSLK